MPSFLRRTLARLLKPAADALLEIVPLDDPWERVAFEPLPAHFGSGSRHAFDWYFEGESTVAVTCLDDILEWLLGCAYVGDHELFREPDYWQHPGTFEQLRRGDCEDFALWAWRKLVELGYDADLVVGYCSPPGVAAPGRHAWVVFRRDGIEYVLEAVRRERAKLVRPASEVRACYVPEFGIDRNRRGFAYVGYLHVRKYPERFRAPPGVAIGQGVAAMYET